MDIWRKQGAVKRNRKKERREKRKKTKQKIMCYQWPAMLANAIVWCTRKLPGTKSQFYCFLFWLQFTKFPHRGKCVLKTPCHLDSAWHMQAACGQIGFTNIFIFIFLLHESSGRIEIRIYAKLLKNLKCGSEDISDGWLWVGWWFSYENKAYPTCAAFSWFVVTTNPLGNLFLDE